MYIYNFTIAVKCFLYKNIEPKKGFSVLNRGYSNLTFLAIMKTLKYFHMQNPISNQKDFK